MTGLKYEQQGNHVEGPQAVLCSTIVPARPWRTPNSTSCSIDEIVVPLQVFVDIAGRFLLAIRKTLFVPFSDGSNMHVARYSQYQVEVYYIRLPGQIIRCMVVYLWLGLLCECLASR